MSADKGIDWPGLLKWSIGYSDGTHEATPMIKERLRFLEAAIKEAMAMYEDPNQVVQESVKKLKEKEASDGDVLNAIKLIQKCVDEAPEMSRDFDKSGALEVLVERINDHNPVIKDEVLQILSFVLPNNPKIQRKAWELNALSLLMDVEKCSESPSRFGALSGLMRHEHDIEKDFINQGGVEILVAGLKSSNPKVQIKAANLLRHLFEEQSIPPGYALKYDLGFALASMINRPVDHDRGVQYGETACSAIMSTLNGCTNLVRTEADSSTYQLSQLRNGLCDRLSYISNLDEHQQESRMIHEALETIEKETGIVEMESATQTSNGSSKPPPRCV